jgi:hypothetical protein
VRKDKVGFRDAGEWIFSLPCGLQGYALTDAKDDLLNEAAINVAYDSTSKDFRVINGRSCVWCHTEGIRPFKSQFQLQIGLKQFTDLGIYLKDQNKALVLADFIRRTFGSPDFDDVIETDRLQYAKAVLRTSGLSTEKNASQFRGLWNGYAEEDLDLNHICYELGLQPEQVKALCALQKNGVSNGVLLQQLLTPPIAIRRDQWEEVVQEALELALVLRK